MQVQVWRGPGGREETGWEEDPPREFDKNGGGGRRHRWSGLDLGARPSRHHVEQRPQKLGSPAPRIVECRRLLLSRSAAYVCMHVVYGLGVCVCVYVWCVAAALSQK